MKVLITGATGLLGSALVPYLRDQGFHVTRLVRYHNELSDDKILWNPNSGYSTTNHLEGFDIIINLAGENIASGRWTKEKKERIYNSRIQSTLFLSKALSNLKNPPKIFLNASAMGYYGDRGDEILTETSGPGTGFLAKVCKDWEESTQHLQKIGIRVVLLRFGMVLSKEGGALEKMKTPFKLGLGGILGSGAQYMSWILIEELCRVVLFTIETDEIKGAINVATPNPVTNREFTKSLGAVLNRPTFMWVPAAIVKLIFGEMGIEMLLSSIRMQPRKLLDAGFTFVYPHIKPALIRALGLENVEEENEEVKEEINF